MAGPEYFNPQAATLLKFAKAVADPEVAAGLVEKTADLKEQANDRKMTMRPTKPIAPSGTG